MQAKAVDEAAGSGKLTPCLIITFFGPLGGAINRETIRKDYNIDGGFIESLCTWCFCGCCAACQEYRRVFETQETKFIRLLVLASFL